MKIDFHCHTKSVKQGETEKRNIDSKRFVEKINDANVKIVAITNHNDFDKKQYEEFVEEANESFQIWPGIELDIKDDETEAHLIIISNPNCLNEFETSINNLIGDNDKSTFIANIEDVLNEFNNKDVIYIGHYIGKKKMLSPKMIELMEKTIEEKYRLFLEPSNYKTLSVMSDNGFRAIMGSDVQDWEKYSSINLPELKLEVDSFNKFLLLAKKDVTTINTLLQKKEKRDIDISIKLKNKKVINQTIPIYNDINVIFGLKGTGKSCIIDGLCDKYIKDGIDCSIYRAKDVDDTIKSMQTINDNEKFEVEFDLNILSKFIEKISKWKDNNPTSLSNYIEYIETKDNNKNKKRLGITKLKPIKNNSTEKYDEYLEKRKTIDNIINEYEDNNLYEFLDDNDKNILKEINNKIYIKYDSFTKEEYIKYKSIELSNNCITKIKEKADLLSSSKSVPNSTGFFEFAKNRLTLKNETNNILKLLRETKKIEEEKIGNLDEDKEVFLRREYKTFFDNETGFKFGQTATTLKSVLKTLKNVNKKSLEDVNEYIKLFNQELKDNNIQATDFIGIKKYFINNKGEAYEPSDGERIMLILDRALFENKEVYILDEPERSLGNNFINDVVLPRINELAKLKKTIIIATHNANIAVRTLPFVSILKEYTKGEYKTYIGNPFVNKLINQDNEEDFKNWKDESIRVLEGGNEAFYDREDVYESR